MVYDHHNHYTVSIVYDYRPLEALQKIYIPAFGMFAVSPVKFIHLITYIPYHNIIMIVGFNTLISLKFFNFTHNMIINTFKCNRMFH